MKRNNKKKAFTLVELLVVIAIIAILAVVGIVGYTAYTKKARNSVAEQELSQVITLITAEDFENDNFAITDKGLEFKEAQTEEGFTIDKILDSATYGEDLKQIKGTFTFNFSSDKTAIESITYKLDNGGEATHTFKAE